MAARVSPEDIDKDRRWRGNKKQERERINDGRERTF